MIRCIGSNQYEVVWLVEILVHHLRGSEKSPCSAQRCGQLAHPNSLLQFAVAMSSGMGDVKQEKGVSLRFLSSEDIGMQEYTKALSVPSYEQQDSLKIISKLLLSEAIMSKISCQMLKMILKSSLSIEENQCAQLSTNGDIIMTLASSTDQRKIASLLQLEELVMKTQYTQK